VASDAVLLVPKHVTGLYRYYALQCVLSGIEYVPSEAWFSVSIGNYIHVIFLSFCEYVLQSVVCVPGAVRRTAAGTHSTYCHSTATILTLYFY
jgi:hypothetical protein